MVISDGMLCGGGRFIFAKNGSDLAGVSAIASAGMITVCSDLLSCSDAGM